MKTFVFLGPSLPLSEAVSILDAEYLPPVTMGDLYHLIETRAEAGDTIAIVDGLFERVPAVWHKEVLYALDKGINVYGASSMGALRAAELHTFGMRGIGRIFSAFRDQVIVDDDEVAVAHAPGNVGYRSLSAAMVSIRFAIEDLVGQGTVQPEDAEQLLAFAKQQHYAERNWGDLIAFARKARLGDEICQALLAKAREPDAKANDAKLLLAVLADRRNASNHERPAPSFVFRKTSFWTAMVRSAQAATSDRAQSGSTTEAETINLAPYYRAAGKQRDHLLSQALFDWLVIASSEDYSPDKTDLLVAKKRMIEGFRDRGIQPNDQWRRENGLTDSTLKAILDVEARRQWLKERLVRSLDSHLLRNLKRSGNYAQFANDISRAMKATGSNDIARLSWQELGVQEAEVEHWYVGKFGAMFPDPVSHAAQLGFDDLRDFVDHLLPNFLCEHPPEIAPEEAVKREEGLVERADGK